MACSRVAATVQGLCLVVVQAAVSQLLFVSSNAYTTNMMLARELASIDLDTCAPVTPVADDMWPCILVRAMSLQRAHLPAWSVCFMVRVRQGLEIWRGLPGARSRFAGACTGVMLFRKEGSKFTRPWQSTRLNGWTSVCLSST